MKIPEKENRFIRQAVELTEHGEWLLRLRDLHWVIADGDNARRYAPRVQHELCFLRYGGKLCFNAGFFMGYDVQTGVSGFDVVYEGRFHFVLLLLNWFTIVVIVG